MNERDDMIAEACGRLGRALDELAAARKGAAETGVRLQALADFVAERPEIAPQALEMVAARLPELLTSLVRGGFRVEATRRTAEMFPGQPVTTGWKLRVFFLDTLLHTEEWDIA
jgi:hypothetical protein